MGNQVATQLLSAEVLTGDAAEMLGDAAGLLRVAGDKEGSEELAGLNNAALVAVERIQRKRLTAEAEASEEGVA